MNRRTNNYEVTKAVYRLKRSHGRYALVKDPLGQGSLNPENGRRLEPYTLHPIRRVIVMSGTEGKKFLYDNAYNAGSGPMSYGALFEQVDKVFLIDGSDLPRGVTLSSEMKIIYQSNPFGLLKIIKTEDNRSYVCIARAIETSEQYALATTNTNLLGDSDGTD